MLKISCFKHLDIWENQYRPSYIMPMQWNGLPDALTALDLRSLKSDHQNISRAVVSVTSREMRPRVQTRARSKGERLLFLPLITFVCLARNAFLLPNVKVRAFHKLITLISQYLQLLVQLAAPGFRLSEDPGSNPGWGVIFVNFKQRPI